MGNAGNVPIITIAVDPMLNDKLFIVPGFGDAGDREDWDMIRIAYM